MRGIGALKNVSCLVVGSGAGGLTTAITLARAGKSVVVLEEGRTKSATPAFSLSEIREDYRSGGQCLAFGPQTINFGLGRVLGGGTAVNSGYYFRPQAKKLEEVATEWSIRDFSTAALQDDFIAIEKDLRPAYYPGASLISEADWKRASAACGLTPDRAQFCHSWDPRTGIFLRRSLMDVWKDEFASLGVEVFSGCRVDHIEKRNGSWNVLGTENGQEKFLLRCDRLILSGGAIETPLLLRRSGMKENVGRGLRFHLFLRMLARFPHEVNVDRCPVFPWKAVDASMNIGHSPDLPHLMGLAFPELKAELRERWRNWSSFYVSIPVRSGCSVRSFGKDGLLFARLTNEEKDLARSSFERLRRFLREAGAAFTYPENPPFHFFQSVHLFGSCPMGEAENTAVDSWGKMRNFHGLHLHDASIIGSSIGQNPQAAIMAVARRNTRCLLAEIS